MTELLSPAGGREALVAAVQNGASFYAAAGRAVRQLTPLPGGEVFPDGEIILQFHGALSCQIQHQYKSVFPMCQFYTRRQTIRGDSFAQAKTAVNQRGLQRSSMAPPARLERTTFRLGVRRTIS